MKKFVKSFLLAASALLLFAGCSNLSEGTVSGTNDEGKGVISIGIEGYSDSAARSARTINPTPYTQATAFTQITLKGESENYDSFDEEALTFDSATGKATKELSYDVWYLTLTAYMGDVPVLQGRRRVDMVNDAPAAGEAITFSLSAEGITSLGGVSLTGTITDASGLAATWEAALYDLYTNEVVDTTAKNGTCSAGFTYTATDIKPGRYNFRIYFKNAAEKSIGTWGDIVVIAPGRTTTGSPALGDILMKAPSAPTALSAYYINNTLSGDYYNALITWTRASLHNEEYFELTINEDGATNPYRVFTAEPNAEHAYEKVFFVSGDWVDGTLAAGSEYCIVKLPVGKNFDLSIKAVNFIGASSAKTRDPATAASTLELSSGETVGENTPYGESGVNLMKITYDLNGGSLKKAAGATPITGSYYEYKVFAGTAITLLVPATAANAYPQVAEGHHPFVKWLDGATEITSIEAFGNKTVTASYNQTSIINYTVDDSYGTLENVSVETASGDDVVNSANTITSNGNLVVTVGDTGVTHVKATILIPNKTDVSAEADGSSVTINHMDKVPNGTFEVQVIATIPDANGINKLYSFVCAITKNQ